MFIPLIYRAALPFYYRHVKRFLAGAQNATRVQRDVLFAKLRRNADSDFGRDHGFAQIQSLEEFRRQVPIAQYDYYSDYVERVKRGDVTAMFAPGTKLLMFAMTSGTTNTSKFVPVTKEFFDEYRDSWRIWGARCYRDHVELTGKKALQLSSNWQQTFTESGIACGNISGLAAEVAPWFASSIHAMPLAVIKINDPAAKHYTALRIAMASRRVGTIITANPSTLLSLAARANSERESLIRDIFDGTLSDEIAVPGTVRQTLRRHIRLRDPQRARELERIADKTAALHPKDFWPHLSLLSVWMGGSVGVYLSRLAEFYGDTALRDHGLSASEGRMTIPLEDNTSAGVLDYLHHYYEFIPADEIDREQPTVLEAHELEVDKNYFILLTTSAGMYRYNIHDVVQCVGFEGRAPVLKFLNKGAYFSSFTGEKLSEFQVVSAVQQTYADLGLSIEDFTVAPRMEGGRPGYVLLLEPSPRERDDDRLAEKVEGRLKQLNCEYADKLASGRLTPLSTLEIPAGTWMSYRQKKTAARGNLEEYKHPCLVNDLEFIDGLLGLAPVTQP